MNFTELSAEACGNFYASTFASRYVFGAMN